MKINEIRDRIAEIVTQITFLTDIVDNIEELEM